MDRDELNEKAARLRTTLKEELTIATVDLFGRAYNAVEDLEFRLRNALTLLQGLQPSTAEDIEQLKFAAEALIRADRHIEDAKTRLMPGTERATQWDRTQAY